MDTDTTPPIDPRSRPSSERAAHASGVAPADHFWSLDSGAPNRPVRRHSQPHPEAPHSLERPLVVVRLVTLGPLEPTSNSSRNYKQISTTAGLSGRPLGRGLHDEVDTAFGDWKHVRRIGGIRRSRKHRSHNVTGSDARCAGGHRTRNSRVFVSQPGARAANGSPSLGFEPAR